MVCRIELNLDIAIMVTLIEGPVSLVLIGIDWINPLAASLLSSLAVHLRVEFTFSRHSFVSTCLRVVGLLFPDQVNKQTTNSHKNDYTDNN